ncbi:MAG TPA: helix-turn-helix domain-containing protein, partial [Clostridia bacterium]|nr:helix-turn-helix domain-containing protein [Clostridia bacterium]
MPRGIPNKRYTGKFKQMVAETMRRDGLSYTETEHQFAITKDRVRKWERIYLEQGAQGLYVERRGGVI